MTLTRATAVITYVALIISLGSSINAEARHHHRHHRSPKNAISLSVPPTAAPMSSPPAKNAISHSSPSPSPAPGDSHSYSLYNVLAYGAVGDGVSDDTEAFKTVWDSACQEMSPSMILVPQGYSFLLRSTIFVGPCQNNLIFQVQVLSDFLISRLL
jgi:polygalacturonase